MKKYILVGALVVSLALPLFAGAMSTAELQAMINSLMAQVKQLQAQLLAQQGGGTTAWCHTFNKNLGVGSRGAEVQALMTAISKEPGGPQAFGTNERGGVEDITFEEGLASWVTDFQERYRDEILTPSRLNSGTGYVGPSTRKKLNQLYGCGGAIKPPVVYCIQDSKQCSDELSVFRSGPNCEFPTCPTTQASIKVLSPNWGEQWQKGTTQTIRWQDNTPIPACPPGAQCSPPVAQRYYDIKLVSYYPPCTGNICPMMPFRAPYNIVSGMSGSSFSWKVGEWYSSSMPESADLGLVPDGSYTVQVCITGTNVCDSSDSYFKITSGSTTGNLPPVIDGVSGSTALGINQQGTWTIKAHDPENGVLSYDVNWGDGMTVMPGGFSQIYGQTYSQQATMTHSYSSAGTYKIVFTVSDNSSQSVQSSITVQVGGGGVTLLTCDNYGDVNMDGAVNSVDALFVSQYVSNLRTLTDEQKLRADVNQDGKVDKADSDMILSYDVGSIKAFPACQKQPPCGQSGDVNGNGYVNRRDSERVLQYEVGSNILTVEQRKRADVNNDGSVNSVDAMFIGQYLAGIINTFAVCSVPQPASVTVLSPNGGESWPIGSTQTIQWNTGGKAGTVSIAVLDFNKTTGDTDFTPYTIKNNTNNTGSFSWVVPSSLGISSASSVGNNYKLLISGYFFTDPAAERPELIKDRSDAPFNIVSQ